MFRQQNSRGCGAGRNNSQRVIFAGRRTYIAIVNHMPLDSLVNLQRVIIYILIGKCTRNQRFLLGLSRRIFSVKLNGRIKLRVTRRDRECGEYSCEQNHQSTHLRICTRGALPIQPQFLGFSRRYVRCFHPIGPVLTTKS